MKCQKCGKEIPDWFQPPLCTICLGWELSTSTVTTTDKYTAPTSSDGDEKSTALAKKDTDFYNLTEEKVHDLLKQGGSHVRIALSTIVREKCTCLLTSSMFYGDVSKLMPDIRAVFERKKVRWQDILIN